MGGKWKAYNIIENYMGIGEENVRGKRIECIDTGQA